MQKWKKKKNILNFLYIDVITLKKVLHGKALQKL